MRIAIEKNANLRCSHDGKVGAPFEYSHTYIRFLEFLKIGFKIAYRTVQGTGTLAQ